MPAGVLCWVFTVGMSNINKISKLIIIYSELGPAYLPKNIIKGILQKNIRLK